MLIPHNHSFKCQFNQKINESKLFICFIFSYNKSKTILKSIDSILNQTFKCNIKIVVIDDCSTDNTLQKIINHNQDRYSIFQSISNFGISKLRNFALDLISNEKYFFFLDGDDFYHQDKIRLSYEILENNQNLNIAYLN